MGGSGNGVYIVQGEVNLVVMAMRRNSRWMSHNHQSDDDQEPLIRSFSQLKDVLNNINDLDELTALEFLTPFLDVIRSEDTTGPITGLALTSVSKFIAYGLIDADGKEAGEAVESIADAVTHARFVGTEPGSDEVVLMKILHVLRTLLLSQSGCLLNNESVCEIMQSCFRICFEMRLSELLRKSAEHTLVDMVQLLFARLPQFKEDAKWMSSLRKLKMKTGGGGLETTRAGGKHRKKTSPKSKSKKSPSKPSSAAVQVAPHGESATEQVAPYGESVTEQVAPHGESVTEQVAPHGESLKQSLTLEGLRCGEMGEESVTSTPGGEELTTPMEDEPHGAEFVVASTPVTVTERNVVDLQRDGFQNTVVVDGCSNVLHAPVSQEQYVWIDESQSSEDKQSISSTSLKITTESYNLDESTTGVVVAQSDSCDVGDVSSSTTAVLGDVRSGWGLSAADEMNPSSEFINPRGVRFTHQLQHNTPNNAPLIPYSLPCIRELLRFLISLINPLDTHNTDVMIHMGLSLLTVAMETGADHLAQYNSLMSLVKDDLSRHLLFLLRSERLTLFAAFIRVCFLMFESLRGHLKLQLEMYVTKLMELIVSDTGRVTHDQREIALESLVQLLRIPGLVTELYLNYDCDLHCSGLFEDLMKLLSKNAFPVSGLYSTHLLSLDALLAVIDSIEQHCHHRVLINSTNNSTSTASTPASTAASTAASTGVNTGVSTGDDVTAPVVSAEAVAETSENKGKEDVEGLRSYIRSNRMKISDNIPTEQQRNDIKHKKKMMSGTSFIGHSSITNSTIYQTGTDQFNAKPMKGVTYLQEHGLLATPLDPVELVTFIRENPKLDKRQIGEYLSNKKHHEILEAYMKSFNFEETRIDEALRMFLETFRLPGEAPVISYILEHFSEYWHKTNGEPFANVDAAFTLAYAVIMLNVDQHNRNAKKQNIPMTCENFKKNVSKVNGGEDFDGDMLEEMYNAVKHEEIVMPSEHTGIVKDNYLWKILLRRSVGKSGEYLHASSDLLDHELFSIVWGPTVAALSFVFDKSSDETIICKAISGFRKCAMISAHYSMSDVFDNLVISLCKFTTLLSPPESVESMMIGFGNNKKAQEAARTVFGLAHRHSDILREGWKNILDCMLQLYAANMLPEVLVKVEDFLDPSGRVSLIREDTTNQQRRNESGVWGGIYSYFTLSDTPQQKGQSLEERDAIERARGCIEGCHVEQLIIESKFLRVHSLHELLKALISASRCPDTPDSLGSVCDEDSAVFCLELLITVVLQNRDRISNYWQMIEDHLFTLIVTGPAPSTVNPSPAQTEGVESSHVMLRERAVVGLLRLAIRLLRRECIAPQVLSSLRMLLMMKPDAIHSVSKQISYGLHDLLKTNAANIHSSHDWFTLFTLLEVVGAGTNPPPLLQVRPGINVADVIQDTGAQSNGETGGGGSVSDRGYTSDSELYDRTTSARNSVTTLDNRPVSHGSWLMVYNDEDEASRRVNQFSIVLSEEIRYSCSRSLLKSSETLAFLVRDAAHVTPHNYESCVHALRMFVEASIDGGLIRQKQQHQGGGAGGKRARRVGGEGGRMRKSRSSPSHLSKSGASASSKTCDSDDEVKLEDSFLTLSIQLLDLMHTLHTRAAGMFSSWADEEKTNTPNELSRERRIDSGTSHLWRVCWCPLLQGIARLCCDTRRQVRSQALTYLQRALLVHDLQTLSATEWESCFNKVLFPLLSKLLEQINPQDSSGVEETRMRASTLLCKVFLQHLTPLLGLSTFTALWLTILEFMDKYMHADKSDLLMEAIPESLKNMLLVMNTAGILSDTDRHTERGSEEGKLWKLTWDRIETFLPTLKQDLFKPDPPTAPHPAVTSDQQQIVQTQQPVSAVNPHSPATDTAASPAASSHSPAASPHSPAAASPHSPAADTSSSAAVQGETAGPISSQQETADLRSAGGSPPPQYILQPPLPSVTPHIRPVEGGPVPLLLNPDLVLTSTNIPAIFPTTQQQP